MLRVDPYVYAITFHMEIISNGESLATLHRVKFTKDRERVSIPWFVAPNHDAQIFPFNVPAENWKYEKIEYMQWWNTGRI